MMKPFETRNRFLDVWPRMVRADSQATITVAPRYGHRCLVPGTWYVVRHFQVHREGGTAYPVSAEQRVQMVDGQLVITDFFESEQEHVLEISPESADQPVAFTVHLFSLRDDLFVRRPWRGDMHMHSHCSDGKESPAFVAASCRRIGLDFMALTDHGQFAPSQEAAGAFADVPVDMLIFPGEEVHPPRNPVHTIHFGGGYSINELMRQDPAAYEREVALIESQLTDIADPIVRYQCASTRWVYRRIAEAGGFSIFCHPYWRVRTGYDVSTAVSDWVWRQQEFDALELLGGYHRFEEDSNTLQLARYHSSAVAGLDLPVVGVSDSHGCENSDLFGCFQTLAFAEERSYASIANSIRQRYSVAVEALPGESVRAFGDFRLVEYALFLLREVLPEHDELCREEASWMLRHLEKDPRAPGMLGLLQGRVDALYRRWWA